MGLQALLPMVGKVIDRVIPDKEKAAEAKLKMMQLEQDGQFREDEMRFNAIVMEAGSKDKWTSRARPGFLYVIYIFILSAIPVGIFSVFSPADADKYVMAMTGYLNAIPGPMWATFTAGYLGYTVKRSEDKARLVNPDAKQGLLSKLF